MMPQERNQVWGKCPDEKEMGLKPRRRPLINVL